MSFCPYCKEIVGSNVTECPSCGMSWSAGEKPQESPEPRNAPAEPQPPKQQTYQQPAQQPAYQQPPQQPVYQQPPPQPVYQQQPPPQYQQPPPQPAYQPQPVYQQPPQQPVYQQPQPQQYQQPYAAPPRPKRMVGAGSMVGAIIGGVMALISIFMLFLQVGLNGTDYISMMDFLDNAPDEFMYAYLIPLFGLIALLTGVIGYAMQNKGMGYLTGIFGILILIIPIVFAFHLASEWDLPIQDVFFFSADIAMGENMWQMFLGGFMAMSAGLMVALSGFGLAGKIRRSERSGPRYYR